MKICKYADIEFILIYWFIQCRDLNVPINRPTIKEKANFLYPIFFSYKEAKTLINNVSMLIEKTEGAGEVLQVFRRSWRLYLKKPKRQFFILYYFSKL